MPVSCTELLYVPIVKSFLSLPNHNGLVKNVSETKIIFSFLKSTSMIAYSPSSFFTKSFPYFFYRVIIHSPSDLYTSSIKC